MNTILQKFLRTRHRTVDPGALLEVLLQTVDVCLDVLVRCVGARLLTAARLAVLWIGNSEVPSDPVVQFVQIRDVRSSLEQKIEEDWKFAS